MQTSPFLVGPSYTEYLQKQKGAVSSKLFTLTRSGIHSPSMESRSTIQGFALQPDKLSDPEKWLSEVTFDIIGDPQDNRFTFDFIGATKPIAPDNVDEFVQNTLNALAITQCSKYKNRICWGARMFPITEALGNTLKNPLTSIALHNSLVCYGEQLVSAINCTKRERPGWLAPGRISVTSFLYRMARHEDAFLDDSGAKWHAGTVGIGMTACIDDQPPPIPKLLMDTPGSTLLSKHVRTIVVCNMGSDDTRATWINILTQTSHLGTELCSWLSLFMQHWNVSQTQLLDDAQLVWCWIDESFSGHELRVARNVFNAFCALPIHDGEQVLSLGVKQRALDTTVGFGFDKLQTQTDWHGGRRIFWISLNASIVPDCSDEQLAYHRDLMYQFIVEEDGAVMADASVAYLLNEIREGLDEMEEAGILEPHPRSFFEHLAGDTIASNELEDDLRVGRISLEARVSPTIDLSSSASYVVRMDGKRAKLVIEGGSTLTLHGRDAGTLLGKFARGIQSVELFGFALGRKATPDIAILQGSMVANLVMQGAFGPSAGLWLLSHILYGDMEVSTESQNGLIRCLAKSTDGLRINVNIDAEIAASIHAATDGKRVFLCLSEGKIFRLRRKGNSICGTLCNVDVTEMGSCSLKPLRGVS